MGITVIWDKESKNLLNSDSIDYLASPYKLKDPEFVHCTGFVDLNSDDEWMFGPESTRKHNHVEFIMEEVDELIGHNTINFDHLLEKLDTGLNYEIGCKLLDIPDRVIYKGRSKDIIITDTLVMSKTLNPDRPQHSIQYFGTMLGLEKIDWRAKAIELGIIPADAPKGAEFRQWHPEMGVYMMRDCHVNKRVYRHLMKEWGDWNWDDAYELEKATAEIITRQEHRGFKFNRDSAVECVKDLDSKMEELRNIVEPLIPPKPLTKGALADVTPVAKQFKMNGDPTTHILNFAKKHGSEFVEQDGVWTAEMYGTKYTLPMPHEPMYDTAPAKLDDTLHIKQWLVGMGWQPTQYKERDLTVDSKKKKLTLDKFNEAVKKWVEQTFDSPFKEDRLEQLEYSPRVSKAYVLAKLLSMDHMKRPIKVYTNPTLTIGMEKDIDPELLKLSEKFGYAKEISHYLTYKHRRNSILGGGIDPDDDEDMQKGWMSTARLDVDGRIPTPADTCGAATSRFKHRLVANVPRVTSMYGYEMRSLFGVDVGFFQMGYDFDSLEAKVEAHYTFRYPGGPEYGISLTAEKPNDCHSVLARAITEILGREFPRSTAKNVKYGCSYNAQIARVAKTVGCSIEEATIIFNAFWKQAYPLKQLKEEMQKYWETTPEPADPAKGKKEVKGGNKKWLLGIDGRKLPIRSKGNVINTAFQSCGVICAKRAMVLHDRYLKAEGLTVDFFIDDWKAKLEAGDHFCQQLIAYHDEAQNEVTRASVTFKMFKFEGPYEIENAKGKMELSESAMAAKKAAEAFKAEQTDKVWSDIGHTDKVFYVAYNRAGELAAKAVNDAGKYYKLKVELTAGYIIGTNWASCH
jgi:DNA polymerase I-like protein with 3'-5' exonuclease and polymerase domains